MTSTHPDLISSVIPSLPASRVDRVFISGTIQNIFTDKALFASEYGNTHKDIFSLNESKTKKGGLRQQNEQNTTLQINPVQDEIVVQDKFFNI